MSAGEPIEFGKLLAALPTKEKPLALAEVMACIARLSNDAYRLASALSNFKTDDAALTGTFHRLGVVLRDMHSGIGCEK